MSNPQTMYTLIHESGHVFLNQLPVKDRTIFME